MEATRDTVATASTRITAARMAPARMGIHTALAIAETQALLMPGVQAPTTVEEVGTVEGLITRIASKFVGNHDVNFELVLHMD